MKKEKKKSDIAIINQWIEDAERYINIAFYEISGSDPAKIFKLTDRANVFEIETSDGVFKITFERKNEKD